MKDNYNRTIDYLRISVTDRCNLRCIYCMPHEDRPIRFKHILSYEEIIKIVKIGAGLGLRKIRLTGGEPLARKNIQYLIAKLKEIDGIEELSMTTNGILLKKYAGQLKEA
ncbi:MAG: radical SAM protein, partial [Nitrospirae bacterium]